MRDDRAAYHRRKFRYRLNESHVSRLAVTAFHLPLWMKLYSLRPIIVGLLPGFLYNILHKKRLNNH
jgi:glycosyltransferase EpsE